MELDIKQLDINDINGIVDLHLSAFPDSLLTKLGRETLYRNYLWQFSSKNAEIYPTGVFIEGKLVAYCIGGFLCGAVNGFLYNNRKHLMKAMMLHPTLLFKPEYFNKIWTGLKAYIRLLFSKRNRNLINGDVKLKTNRRQFGILVIATHPLYQKYSLGIRLMIEIENIAKNLSCETIILSVNTSNNISIGFYSLRGYKIVKEDNNTTNMVKTL